MLLDDVLSAVDAHVGAELFDKCIKGVLKGKTVVLVTHAVHILPGCDQVIVLNAGKLVEKGSYAELMAEAKSEMRGLVEMYADETADSHASVDRATKPVEQQQADTSKKADEESEKDSDVSTPEVSAEARDLTGEEESKEGRVKASVYIAYIRAASMLGISAVASLFLANPLTQAGTTFWLALWAEDAYNSSQDWYLGVYVGISFGYVAAPPLTHHHHHNNSPPRLSLRMCGTGAWGSWCSDSS